MVVFPSASAAGVEGGGRPIDEREVMSASTSCPISYGHTTRFGFDARAMSSRWLSKRRSTTGLLGE